MGSEHMVFLVFKAVFCIILSVCVYCQVSNERYYCAGRHDVTTIVEHPSSLVVPVNEIAVFSCTARCTPSQCDSQLEGRWFINDTFGPMYYGGNNLSMSLMLNTSNARNNSKVRCNFGLNEIQHSGELKHVDSEAATLIFMDGELQLINYV